MNSVLKGNVKHLFSLKTSNEVKKVLICGSFDNWQNKYALVPSIGADGSKNWFQDMWLDKKKYQYKYLVDDEWRCDPASTICIVDGGNINNEIDLTGKMSKIYSFLYYITMYLDPTG